MAARLIAGGGAVLFVVALPLAIALSNFRWFVSEPGMILQGQERNAVSRSTGLSPSELAAVDRGMVRYLHSDRASLQASLAQEGVARSPFSDRDTAHMLDVHDMIGAALRLQRGVVTYVLLFLAVALVAGARRLAARAILAGSLFTIGVLGLLGVLSLLDWNALFLEFHFLSFSNDLWLLDPARDALIVLYPPGFFMDSTVRLVVMSLIEAALLAVLAGVFLRLNAAKGRRTA